MRPLLLLVPALLAAAELPAPAITLHPDGAHITWRLELPAGASRLDLPAWCGRQIAVRGASSWAVAEETTTAPPLPAALAALLPERNRLQARGQVLDQSDRVLTAAEQRWRSASAQQTAAGNPDPAAIQAAIDVLVAERARLEDARATLVDERRALADRARAATGSEAGAMVLGGDGPMSTADLTEAWRIRAGSGRGGAHVDLQLAAAGTVVVEELRSDGRWESEAELRLAGGTAVLARRAVLVRPDDFPTGRLAVALSTAPANPLLTAPTAPRVAITAQPVADSLRRLVVTSQRESSWAAVSSVAPSGGTSAGAVSYKSDLAATRQSTAVVATEPAPRFAGISGSPVAIDLGTIDLRSGSDRITVPLGDSPLAIVADEWALFPEERPAAVRRVTVRLDAQPLLPGDLCVRGEGQLPVTSSVEWLPAGGTLTVCAGIDERIVVTSNSAWDIWPGDNTRQRRREGRDTWFISAAPQPVKVAVYRTMPVAMAEEVAVEADPGTTPGATAVIPGLMRWELTLAPGQPTRIGLGWILKASGSFKLAE